METSSKKTSNENPPKNSAIISLFIVAILFATASCSTVEDANTIAPNITERTDISVRGDMNLDDFRQSAADDASNDLISYNYYGSPSEDFDFIINLNNGYTLTINVHDAQRMNPWEQVDLPFNIYAGQDLDDKLYYTNIIFSNPDGSCAYSTNSDNNIPPGTFIDVFKIMSNDGEQIQCRIRDMILYRTNNPDKTITLNGTFIGSMNF